MRRLLPLIALIACSPQPPTEAAQSPAAEREPVIHVHVPDKVAEGDGRFKADWSFDLVTGARWSAHVHVIPEGQLVPTHHHPDNDELVFVANGEGWWMSHYWEPGGTYAPTGPGSEAMGVGFRHQGVRDPAWAIEPGDAVLSPAGSAHAVRNLRAAPLATIVIQRPEFGQNWFLLPDEVRGEQRSRSFLPERRTPARIPGVAPEHPPDPVFDGWTLDWLAPTAPAEEQADAYTLYLVSGGGGSLGFEEHDLPLAPGTFAAVPGGLLHQLRPGPDGLEVLRVRTDGPGSGSMGDGSRR